MKRMALMAMMTALAVPAVAQTTQPLFHIARTKNANILYYEARLNASGELDAKDPIKTYWIMWAKDSTGKTTEGMNFIERTKVYGYNIKPDSTGRTYNMNLKPFKERMIRVSIKEGKARAEMDINEKPASFEKMFIYAKGDSKPDSIKLYGTYIGSGEKAVELFLPNKK